MTTQNILIRDETKDDAVAITEVTVDAFETLEISDHTEQFVVDALRAAGALTLSLVAELDGRVVGHIAFSPVAISDGTPDWYGLGPVSVLPKYQRMGIGKALIQEGLSRLKSLGAKGCCLVGHPNYYPRFGFVNVTDLVVEGVPPEVFFALSFDGHLPHGTVTFHEGFTATGNKPAPKMPLFHQIDCVRLPVADLDAALAFYRDRLGHRLIWRTEHAAGLGMPDTDAEIVLHTEDEGVEIDFLVDSADEAATQFVAAGGKIIAPPFDIQIGRCVVVQDPWGNNYVLLDMSKGSLQTDANGNMISKSNT
jgi:putative acetyltransferase